MLPNPDAEESTPLLPSDSPARADDGARLRKHAQLELKGYVYVFFSAVCLAQSIVFNRQAQALLALPIFAALLIRASVQLSFTVLLNALVPRGGERRAPVPCGGAARVLEQPTYSVWTIVAVAANALLTAIGIPMLYSGLRLLPAGDAAALCSTTPVFTMALGAIFLRERVSRTDALAALLSLVGSVLVAAPWAAATSSPSLAAMKASSHLLGVVFVLGYVATAGVGFTLVGALSNRVSVFAIVAAAALAMLALSLPMNGLGEVLEAQPRARWTMVLAALLGCCGQLAMTRGLQMCRVGAGMVVSSVEVPITYAMGLALLHESPGMVQTVGALLVLVSTVIMGVHKLS